MPRSKEHFIYFRINYGNSSDSQVLKIGIFFDIF